MTEAVYVLPGSSRGRGFKPWGGVLPYVGYIGMCRSEGNSFQAVFSGIGYKPESLGLEQEYRVSVSRKLINWLKILV